MIDIHSHILNNIDDGSKDIEMSISMLKKAELSGTTDIIATPHFMRGRFEVEYNEVLNRVENLKKISRDNNIDINIYAGQEVYYSRKLIEYYLIIIIFYKFSTIINFLSCIYINIYVIFFYYLF